MKIFSYTCPAFSFAKANWYFYSQNTFPKSPTANGDESGEKCSVRKTKHMFHIKKKILNISLSILSIQSPKEKEVRKLTAYLVNGRLRDLFSMHPGGSSYSPTQLENAPWLVWAHQDHPHVSTSSCHPSTSSAPHSTDSWLLYKLLSGI